MICNQRKCAYDIYSNIKHSLVKYLSSNFIGLELQVENNLL